MLCYYVEVSWRVSDFGMYNIIRNGAVSVPQMSVIGILARFAVDVFFVFLSSKGAVSVKINFIESMSWTFSIDW